MLINNLIATKKLIILKNCCKNCLIVTIININLNCEKIYLSRAPKPIFEISLKDMLMSPCKSEDFLMNCLIMTCSQ